MDTQQKTQLLFTELVLIFHAAAMHQMGKIKNPVSGKIERNLIAAQDSIDMLDMLKEKSKGNLSPEEGRMLEDVLRELRLNYVDEVNKDQIAAQASKPDEGKQQ
jgi:hypothetical protein